MGFWNYLRPRATVPSILMIIVVISAASMMSALSTQAQQQIANAQLDIQEQKSYVTDVNVHFKAACFSVIIFTYCF